MCGWGAKCNPIGQCESAPETLGCLRPGPNCETCALGFLVSFPTKRVALNPTWHKNPKVTIGVLTEQGWKVTRPGAGTGLKKGQVITKLNDYELNKGIKTAQDGIVFFGSYRGEQVRIELLESTDPNVGIDVKSMEYTRI